MKIDTFILKPVTPPKDDLLEKIKKSKLSLRDGDILCVTSKVISIDEGRCVKINEKIQKDNLAIKESSLYIPRGATPGRHALHTITKGVLIRTAGIDESNGNGHFILWPKNPARSASRIRKFLQKNYKVKNIGVIVTDSISHPLRRGASGFALAFSGFSPLKDYRGERDIFGRKLKVSVANIADAVAAASVLCMGEGGERTPIARVRGLKHLVPGKIVKGPWDSFVVPLKEDIFAPFLKSARWRRGGGKSKKQ